MVQNNDGLSRKNSTFNQEVTGSYFEHSTLIEDQLQNNVQSKVTESEELLSGQMIGVAEAFGLTSIFGKTKEYKKSVYKTISMWILACLVARMLYLGVSLCKEQNEWLYGEITGQLPVIVKYLTALYVCKYKIHIYYI